MRTINPMHHHATITMHTAHYHLTDGRIRPVEVAVVRRKRDGRTVRVRVIDAGAATATAAHQTALHFAGGNEIGHSVVEHGDLGTFGLDDQGRDDMLAAVGALDLGLGTIHVVEGSIAFAGKAPLSVQNSAVHADSAR